MSITKQFQKVSRNFTLIVISLCVMSVGLLLTVLYQTNSVRFGGSVSSSELKAVVKEDQAVVDYLESEKDFEAHFVTIASLVKQDQQKSLGKVLIITTIPVVLIVAVIGFVVAKYLLRPVRESYESQERFLQDAAHELRNPLAAMSLAIENASESSADKNLLKIMRRQTKRLIRLNEDLLYLERRTPGNTVQNTNVSELLEDVLEDLQILIIDKNLSLTTDIHKNITLKMDPKDFIKMSRNIVENAIKYSKPGMKLVVKLSHDKQTVLTVKDLGIGIPPEDIKHIGKRFYRSKNVGKIDGTGLGLAIVKKVLSVYGGSLSITSSKPKGTTVKITF